MSNILELNLADLQKAIRDKNLSAKEIIEAYLQAIEQNDQSNCFISITEEKAIQMAEESDKRIEKGEALALDGIPIGVKDLFCTSGVRTTAGSNMLSNFVPQYESTVTEQLWRDGAIMLLSLIHI